MTGSYTYVDTTTETFTHAKRLASKVATDLKRMQRQCGIERHSDKEIADFEKEIAVLISTGYLKSVKYGFQRNGFWIKPTIEYTALQLYNSANDDRPGGIHQIYDVSGACFASFLCYEQGWYRLTAQQRTVIENRLPFRRTIGEDAGFNGVMVNDKSYSSGNLGLNRSMLRSF